MIDLSHGEKAFLLFVLIFFAGLFYLAHQSVAGNPGIDTSNQTSDVPWWYVYNVGAVSASPVMPQLAAGQQNNPAPLAGCSTCGDFDGVGGMVQF